MLPVPKLCLLWTYTPLFSAVILGLWELWEEGFRENIGSEHPREQKSGNEEVIWDGGRYPCPVLCLGIGVGWKTEPCLAQAEIPPCSPSIPAGSRNLPLILQNAPLGSCLSSRKIRRNFPCPQLIPTPPLWPCWAQGTGPGSAKPLLSLGAPTPRSSKAFPHPSFPRPLGGRELPRHGGTRALSPHSSEFPGVLCFLGATRQRIHKEYPSATGARGLTGFRMSWCPWSDALGAATVPCTPHIPEQSQSDPTAARSRPAASQFQLFHPKEPLEPSDMKSCGPGAESPPRPQFLGFF